MPKIEGIIDQFYHRAESMFNEYICMPSKLSCICTSVPIDDCHCQNPVHSQSLIAEGHKRIESKFAYLDGIVDLFTYRSQNARKSTANGSFQICYCALLHFRENLASSAGQ